MAEFLHRGLDNDGLTTTPAKIDQDSRLADARQKEGHRQGCLCLREQLHEGKTPAILILSKGKGKTLICLRTKFSTPCGRDLLGGDD